METKLLNKMEESINKILDEGLNTTNLETLLKLSKIKHYTKEDMNMMNEYNSRRPGYDNYGDYGNYNMNYGNYNYGNYNRRGYDMKYRGYGHLDRMSDNYGRYEEGRRSYNEGNYNAKEDTLKSLEYMLESATDFFKMLKEEANSQEEINMIRKYAQKISQM